MSAVRRFSVCCGYALVCINCSCCKGQCAVVRCKDPHSFGDEEDQGFASSLRFLMQMYQFMRFIRIQALMSALQICSVDFSLWVAAL